MSTDKGACPPLPDAFVRLRYFFGKRLGVADLRDEQAYHHGKMRLHNRHLHGSGVVCGLRLTPFDALDAESTVLRVARGAALDSCGNEVLVSHDQCIDLSAWFRRAAEEVAGSGEHFPPAGAVVDGVLKVCIALRYRECATTPEPAPRDPCSCDAGGCEYGRIQEGFELKVLLREEAQVYASALLSPDAEVLEEALSTATSVEELQQALGRAVGAGCGESRDPDWILLGCLDLVLDEDGLPASLGQEEWTGPPSFLLSTAVLQHLLLLSLQRGPASVYAREAKVTSTAQPLLTLESGDAGLSLRLPLDEALESSTLSAAAVELRRLGGRSGWTKAKLKVSEEQDSAGSALHLQVSTPHSFLQAGRFQLRVGHERTVVTQSFTPVHRELFFHLEQGPEGLVLTQAIEHGRPA